MGALGNMREAIKSKLTGATPSKGDEIREAGKRTVTVDVKGYEAWTSC